jgi:lipopolysaccharide assembly protein A
MRILAWLIGLPLAVLVTVFAVANRAEIRFELWPLPFTVDLPGYLAVLGPLALGLAFGFTLGAASGLKARLRSGEQRRRAESLQRQLDSVQSTPPQA